MNNASLISPTFKMLAVGLSFACSLAYSDTEGYLSASTASGYSEVGPSAVFAGQSQAGVTAREAARRKAEEKAAHILLTEGRDLYKAGRYHDALEKYEQAWERVPKAPATRKLQEFIRLSISDGSIAVAIENAKVGRYDEAEQLLLNVLKLDPNNTRARKELSQLRDPVRNNPALTPEHVRDVDEVNRLLSLAWGYYDLGKYNEADAEFEKVIRIDPYNVAARRGQEAVQQRRMNYFIAAHDSYRAKALAEVSSLWENNTSVSVIDIAGSESVHGRGDVGLSEKQIQIGQMLDNIRIARVSLDDTPISDVVEFIRGEVRRSGNTLNINYVKRQETPVQSVVAPVSSSGDEDDENEDEEGGSSAPAPVAVAVQPAAEPTVSISLDDVSVRELLNQIMGDQLVYVVRDQGLFIYTKGDPNSVVLQTRVFDKVPWEYISSGGEGDDEDDSDEEDDAFGDKKASKGGKFDAVAALKGSGIDFGSKGARATYNPRLQRLTVVNTMDQLDEIENLIDDNRKKSVKMVKVTTKFVEVSQANDEELSFDWVVNPFSVSNNGSTFLGGGTASGGTPTRTYNDFITSGGSAYSNYHKNSGSWPVQNNSSYSSGSDPLTSGLVTAGNRSGTGAIMSSSMDSLIASGSPTTSANASPAPGILSLTGIYDTGSFQMIMRGLSQKRGVDVMSAPSLVMIPGADNAPQELDPDPRLEAPISVEGAARIEVVRRFVYPTQYDEPQIPQNTNQSYRSSSVPVAAPSNPTEWGVEEVGVVAAIAINEEPSTDVIKFNGFVVRVVDFEGFINYGSPIISGIASQTQIETIVLTENRIDQPIFSRKMVNTSLSLYDGYTVAIGGMIEDRVQKVEDKVPVFGDLPLIGRFFRSNVESHTRKNLTIFVTAELIDPTGRPINNRLDSQSGSAASAPGLLPDDGLPMP